MYKLYKYVTGNEISYYTKIIDKEKNNYLENNSYNGISEKIKYHMFVFPSLKECLENKTHAPFCTYNFNAWLKEVESMNNYLDFLLDLISHKRLIQSYKSLNINSLDNEYLYYQSSPNNQINAINNYQNDSSSNILNHRSSNISSRNDAFRGTESDNNSLIQFKEFSDGLNNEQDISSLNISISDNSFISHSTTTKRNISEKDLLYSAKQIYKTYLVNEDHSKNIDASPTTINELGKKIYEEKQWQYELFEDIYHQALYILNTGPYQRFLIKRIKSNVSRKHSLFRLIFGLILFFIIIGYLFILVFYKSSRMIRALYSYIPLFFSLSSISVYVNDFDFIVGYLGKSISGYFEVIDIKDEEIKKFHRWKSRKNLIFIVLLDIIISTIFVIV